MKLASLRTVSTCASLLFAGALAMNSASAAVRELATVTFTQPVEVGTAMLPAGNYHIDAAGDNAFIVQSDNGETTAVMIGTRVDVNNGEDAKTHVVLRNDGEAMRLDKLIISGEGTAYDFMR